MFSRLVEREIWSEGTLYDEETHNSRPGTPPPSFDTQFRPAPADQWPYSSVSRWTIQRLALGSAPLLPQVVIPCLLDNENFFFAI
jgi:hypothetical protein